MKILKISLLLLALSTSALQLNAQQVDPIDPQVSQGQHSQPDNSQSKTWYYAATEEIGNRSKKFAAFVRENYQPSENITNPILVGATAGLLTGLATKIIYRINNRSDTAKAIADENKRAFLTGLMAGVSASSAVVLWNIIKNNCRQV